MTQQQPEPVNPADEALNSLHFDERAFLATLGVNPDTVTPGTLKIFTVDGVPKMSFEATYNVPPHVLARAYTAAGAPMPQPDMAAQMAPAPSPTPAPVEIVNDSPAPEETA